MDQNQPSRLFQICGTVFLFLRRWDWITSGITGEKIQFSAFSFHPVWCHWTGIRSCQGTSTWVTLVKVMRTKGTPDYDRMFGLKPLMDAIRLACQGFFHPGQNHSIDERMVETKAQHSMKKFIQSKPTKWGHRLFVLADSSDGYTASHSLPVMFPDKTIIQQLWLSSVCRQLLHFWRPPPCQKNSEHVPLPTSYQSEMNKMASYGRVHCRQTREVNQSTPWKCQDCDVALCLIADRNCFEKWHQ